MKITEEATDQFLERVCNAMYEARHLEEPSLYKWHTWQEFKDDPANADHIERWRRDMRFGVDIILKMLRE